jgi:hypothetical protein
MNLIRIRNLVVLLLLLACLFRVEGAPDCSDEEAKNELEFILGVSYW